MNMMEYYILTKDMAMLQVFMSLKRCLSKDKNYILNIHNIREMNVLNIMNIYFHI